MSVNSPTVVSNMLSNRRATNTMNRTNFLDPLQDFIFSTNFVPSKHFSTRPPMKSSDSSLTMLLMTKSIEN